MDSKTSHEIFKRFKANNPHPTTELKAHNTFELLISVILSAQATDVGVNKATPALFKAGPTPEKMLCLGEEGIKEHIKTLNLYKTKAKNVFKTCERLVHHFNSVVPVERADLESLAGVGRKTANVVLNTAFNQETIAVDTHIFRVCNRTTLAIGKTPRQIEDQLLKVIPQPFLKDAHHWLVLHGRYVCTARKPKCTNCLINDLCPYPQKSV